MKISTSPLANAFVVLHLFVSCSSAGDKGDFAGKGNAAKKPKPSTPESAGNVEVKSRKLSIVPSEITLFKGESIEFKASVTDSSQPPKDVTTSSTWASLDASIFGLSANKGTAQTPGVTSVTSKFEDLSASVPVTVVPCQSSNPGVPAKKIRIDGENWPGNTIDKNGADFNDYSATISGKFLVDGFQLFSTEDQVISISYSLGSPGSTTQVVKLDVVDCSGKSKGAHEVSSGTGSVTLDSKKGDRFKLITTATTGTVVRVFDLIKDHASAFRLTTLE